MFALRISGILRFKINTYSTVGSHMWVAFMLQ